MRLRMLTLEWMFENYEMENYDSFGLREDAAWRANLEYVNTCAESVQQSLDITEPFELSTNCTQTERFSNRLVHGSTIMYELTVGKAQW